MSSRFLVPAVFLLVFLTVPFFQASPSMGQDVASARQSLVDAFDAVRFAEASGVATDEITRLTIDLNRALDLQNSNGTMSGELSAQIVSRSITLQKEAQAAGQRTAIVYFSVAVWLGVLSAVTVLEAHRIVNLLRRRRS